MSSVLLKAGQKSILNFTLSNNYGIDKDTGITCRISPFCGCKRGYSNAYIKLIFLHTLRKKNCNQFSKKFEHWFSYESCDTNAQTVVKKIKSMLQCILIFSDNRIH